MFQNTTISNTNQQRYIRATINNNNKKQFRKYYHRSSLFACSLNVAMQSSPTMSRSTEREEEKESKTQGIYSILGSTKKKNKISHLTGLCWSISCIGPLMHADCIMGWHRLNSMWSWISMFFFFRALLVNTDKNCARKWTRAPS